jgi:hypothetical protein
LMAAAATISFQEETVSTRCSEDRVPTRYSAMPISTASLVAMRAIRSTEAPEAI